MSVISWKHKASLSPSAARSLVGRILLLALATTVAGLLKDDPVGAQEPREETAEQFAARLQEKYDAVRDMSADFVQTYEGGALRRKTSERGTLVIKKPGRMRWTYTAPEEKVFVSDGTKMYSWVPADKQVVVRDVPAGGDGATPMRFLVGRGSLSRDFTPSFTTVDEAPPSTVALRLTPRRPDGEYEYLVALVDRNTLQLRMLQAVDAQGGVSRFTFSNLKENVGVPDRSFAFRIPRGADVVTQ